MVAFFLITSLLLLISWVIFLIGLFTKRVARSKMYGIMAVTYVAHALSCQMMGLPYVFFLVFSIFCMAFHILYKKIENNVNQ